MTDRPTGACVQGRHDICHGIGCDWKRPPSDRRFVCLCPCHKADVDAAKEWARNMTDEELVAQAVDAETLIKQLELES